VVGVRRWGRARSIAPFVIAAIAGVGLAAGIATASLAYWDVAGSGVAHATTDTLDAPSLTGAVPGEGTVTLTWAAVTPPGGSVSYYVTRDGASAGGNCPTSTTPGTALTCTDSGLAKGSYVYAVTVVLHSWSATSSPATPVTVASGALAHLSLAAATATPAAGAADNLTITALDAGGNTVTSYTGTHTLTFGGASSSGSVNPTVTDSSGAAIAFGSTTAITFASGVSTVSGASNGVMRLYKVETASITVSEGGSYASAALSVTVSLPAGLDLKAQYKNYDAAAPNDNQIKPGIQVVNRGSLSVPLSAVTARYWFTGDGGATSFSTWCDYALLDCSNVTMQISPVSPTRTGADEVFKLGWSSGAGSLAGGASTGDAQTRFNKTDWSVFNETNDYSYTSGTSYADNSKVTVYYYGNLVWGTEP
jgi:hypothetical protein